MKASGMSAGASAENEAYKNRYKYALTGKGHGSLPAKAVEWRNQDGTIGSRGYTTHTLSSDELGHVVNAIGVDLNKINGKEIYDADGDFINAEEIASPNLLADTRIYSPRTGEEVNLDGVKYSVASMKPKVHRIDGRSYLESNILYQ